MTGTRLAGRRALVLGAGSGIGRASALQLARDGARVVAGALHAATADETVRLGEADGLGLVAVSGDVAEREGAERVVAEAIECLGGIDLFVHSAGGTATSPFLSEDDAYWQHVLALNLWSVLWTTRSIARAMQAGGSGGAIVYVTSDAGKVGSKHQAVYAAAKGGVHAFMRSLARELSVDGIRLNAVAPGPTRTRLLDEAVRQPAGRDLVARIERQVPLRRLGLPEEMAHAVAFLASDDAAYMTGQILSVSGGLTMA